MEDATHLQAQRYGFYLQVAEQYLTSDAASDILFLHVP